MKKFLFSILVSFCALSAAAQTQVMRINLGDRVVTYQIDDIREITFDVEQQQADTTLFHAFEGYITVTTAYFTDSYYGDNARLSVWKTSEGEYIVTFSDPTWGEGSFTHVTVGRELDGQGTITMSNPHGGFADYEATISGPMTVPVITIPSVMGGTTITFHVGEAPEALAVSGSHRGTVSVMVGDSFGPYLAENVSYVISANDDGTINVAIPGYKLENTVMGDLTLGDYTVQGVAYDEERAVFYRDYSADEVTMHLKAEKDGTVTMDGDYSFTALGTLEVKTTADGALTIVNHFKPGRMPFAVLATFEKAQTR